MMTHNECNDSVTCMISEKAMEDEIFIKTHKCDQNEFSKHGCRGHDRHGERIDVNLNSRVHRNAVGHSAVANGFNDNQRVNSQTNAQFSTMQAHNREHLKSLFQTVRLLAKQGLAYRGKTPEDSNFRNLLNELLETKGTKSDPDENNECTCSDMQNEITNFFYEAIMRKIMGRLEDNEHFCIMADEASDSSNSELLSLVVHQVTSKFVVEECLLGFYELDNIKAEHMTKCVKVSVDVCSCDQN